MQGIKDLKEPETKYGAILNNCSQNLMVYFHVHESHSKFQEETEKKNGEIQKM